MWLELYKKMVKQRFNRNWESSAQLCACTATQNNDGFFLGVGDCRRDIEFKSGNWITKVISWGIESTIYQLLLIRKIDQSNLNDKELTFDDRNADGRTVTRLVQQVSHILEEPARVLIKC